MWTSPIPSEGQNQTRWQRMEKSHRKNQKIPSPNQKNNAHRLERNPEKDRIPGQSPRNN